MDNNEKIVIVGKSGSGKDYLLSRLKDVGYKSAVKITTRPKREGEIDGINYHFIKNEEFTNRLNSDDIIINQKFNIEGDIWQYGYDRISFTSSNVFILTPNEVLQMSKEDREQCCIIYLDIDRDIRMDRIVERNDNNDTLDRRLKTDDIDFQNFNDYDVRISDPEFTTENILSLIF